MASSGQQSYSGRPLKWRVLGVLTGPTADALVDGDEKGLGAIEEIFSLPGAEAEVHVIKYPRLEDLSTQLQGWKPNFVYVYGGVNGDKKDVEKQTVSHLSFLIDKQGRFVEPALRLFLASFGGLHLDTVYFDSMGCSQIGEALHAAGVPNVIVWPQEAVPLCLPAMHFARAFFCMLRNKSMAVPEAFALATHMSKAYFSQQASASSARSAESSFPHLLSKTSVVLPGIATVPPLILNNKDVSSNIVESVPGYDQIRLLAPNAELRMLACGLSSFINSESLAYLGESLRALLTMEMRRLTVKRVTPCEKTPEHLPPSCSAVRCEIMSFSGVPVTVILGGPVEVLQHQAVVEHALRQTLVADAHSLQFKLPPPNVPLPASRTNPVVANGAPVVEALVVTSVWCVQLLKVLCQDSSYRGLVAAGIGAISNSPVVSFSKADAKRYTTVVTNNDPTKLLQAPVPGENGASADLGDHIPATNEGMHAQPSRSTPGISPRAVAGASATSLGLGSAPRPPSAGGQVGTTPSPLVALQRAGSAGAPAQAGSSAHGSHLNQRMRSESPEHNSTAGQTPIRIRQHMHVAPWRSNRPPIKQCSEEQFMSDLIAFLTDRQGRQIDPKNFPEAILNGSRLDLFNLYREVCNRGGYQVGNGINWKGQVFPRMRNYTAQHKMTGVGNALKRHYQMFLMEYEHAHPEDVNGGQCALCGQGEECGTDWISCDMCDCWVHFSCDKRPFLGSFKEYSRGKTRTYCCPRCYEIKRQRSMQQQQPSAAAAVLTTQPGASSEPRSDSPAHGIKAEPAALATIPHQGQDESMEELPAVESSALAAVAQPTTMVIDSSPVLPPSSSKAPTLTTSQDVPASVPVQQQPTLVQQDPGMSQPLSAPQQQLHTLSGMPGILMAAQHVPSTVPAEAQAQPIAQLPHGQPFMQPSAGLPVHPMVLPQGAGLPFTQPQPTSQPAVSIPQVQMAAPQFHITLAPPKPQQQQDDVPAQFMQE